MRAQRCREHMGYHTAPIEHEAVISDGETLVDADDALTHEGGYLASVLEHQRCVDDVPSYVYTRQDAIPCHDDRFDIEPSFAQLPFGPSDIGLGVEGHARQGSDDREEFIPSNTLGPTPGIRPIDQDSSYIGKSSDGGIYAVRSHAVIITEPARLPLALEPLGPTGSRPRPCPSLPSSARPAHLQDCDREGTSDPSFVSPRALSRSPWARISA